MSPEGFLSLLQFADGLFPTGNYAHSLGLESYVEAGQIRDLPGVEVFLSAYLEGAAGPCDTVAMLTAMSLGQAGDLQACLTLDQTLDAIKPVSELREASRQMGRQTLRVAAALTDQPSLHGFWKATEAGHTPGHHPLGFGMAGAAFEWSAKAAALAFLYGTAALITGAALRLLPLGQLDGQRLLRAAAPLITRLACEAEGKGPADLWSFVPGIEIAGMRHAALEARLFRS